MAARFTRRQGEYLAFIHLYTLLNRRPPAEADIQTYFGVSSAAVHQMVVGLEAQGLIARTPGQARSLRVLVPVGELPALEGDGTSLPAQEAFTTRYPFVALWTREQGYIEVGYDPNTGTWVRALDAGGMVWSGGSPEETPDAWLQALEVGIRAFMDAEGIPKR